LGEEEGGKKKKGLGKKKKGNVAVKARRPSFENTSHAKVGIGKRGGGREGSPLRGQTIQKHQREKFKRRSLRDGPLFEKTGT